MYYTEFLKVQNLDELVLLRDFEKGEVHGDKIAMEYLDDKLEFDIWYSLKNGKINFEFMAGLSIYRE